MAHGSGVSAASAMTRGVRAAVLACALVATFPVAAQAAHKRSTRLTSNAPTTVMAHATVRIVGHLRTTSGGGIKGQPVSLWWRAKGASSFKRLARTRTGAHGRYRFTLTFGTTGGALEVWFNGSRRWRRTISGHAVTVTVPQNPTTTPTPTPTPVPTPTPQPTPTPTLPDPTTVTTYPMSSSPNGLTAGEQQCVNGQIFRDYPLVSSPTGTVVYAIDKLYARPSNGSAGWHVDASGSLYYNGTNRPVYDWYQEGTNQPAGLSQMDTWNISSGWIVTMIQYVWDNGIWYRSPESDCAF